MAFIHTTASAVEKLNQHAKQLRKASGATVPLAAFLDEVAKKAGYHHWKHVTVCLAQSAKVDDLARDSLMRRPLLERRSGYLKDPQQADPELAARETQVFAQQLVEPNSPWSAEGVLAQLRDRVESGGPILIRSIFTGGLMTVMAEVIGDHTLRFGRSAPRGNQEADFAEIRRILRANGLPTAVEPAER